MLRLPIFSAVRVAGQRSLLKSIPAHRVLLPSSKWLSTSRPVFATFQEQPIMTSPNGTNKNPGPEKDNEGGDDKKTAVFSKEELEAARLARLANLGWLSKLPEKMIPYAELMRLEKPIGTLLLLVPSFWGITMAAYSIAAPLTTTLSAVALFSIGAVVMRGAGCTINDIWDRDLDNQVARTMERPITSRRVSVPQAVTFLAGQCFVGLVVLLSLPFECFYAGALSLPFVATYPLFKRFTYYPQACLSICFAWGTMLGFPAVGAPFNWAVILPLFFSKFCWSMLYDTVYAHQDKMYDIKAGIKSTALKWGDKSKPILNALGAVQTASFVTAGFMNSMGPCFYLGSAWGFSRMLYKLNKVDLDNPKECGAFFLDNIKNGYILWLGMLADYFLLLLGFL